MFQVLGDFETVRVEHFKQATEQKLRDVRCPYHQRRPRLRFVGNSLRDITISITGCCSKVMEIANSRIGVAPVDAAAPLDTKRSSAD